MYCWVGKRVTEERKEFRSCSAQRLAAVFRVSQATCRVAAETEASAVEEAFDNETGLEPPKAVLSSQYLIQVDELSSNDICVRLGEVRLRKTQVDLLYCTVTRNYGRVAYMHQFDMQQAGPQRAGLADWQGRSRIAYCTCTPYLTPQPQSRSSSVQL